MAKEMNVLEIKSSNIDLNGIWHRKVVEEEMIEIGLQPVNYDSWIGYILNHFDFPDHIIEALEDDNVYEMKFIFENDKICVVKH